MMVLSPMNPHIDIDLVIIKTRKRKKLVKMGQHTHVDWGSCTQTMLTFPFIFLGRKN